MSHKIREDLLTSEQAEKYLGLARNTLATWRSRGTGPDFIKNEGGRYIRYLTSDLDFWLDSCKQGVKF